MSSFSEFLVYVKRTCLFRLNATYLSISLAREYYSSRNVTDQISTVLFWYSIPWVCAYLSQDVPTNKPLNVSRWAWFILGCYSGVDSLRFPDAHPNPDDYGWTFVLLPQAIFHHHSPHQLTNDSIEACVFIFHFRWLCNSICHANPQFSVILRDRKAV